MPEGFTKGFNFTRKENVSYLFLIHHDQAQNTKYMNAFSIYVALIYL